MTERYRSFGSPYTPMYCRKDKDVRLAAEGRHIVPAQGTKVKALNLSQSLKYALIAAENLRFSARIIAASCSDRED